MNSLWISNNVQVIPDFNMSENRLSSCLIYILWYVKPPSFGVFPIETGSWGDTYCRAYTILF